MRRPTIPDLELLLDGKHSVNFAASAASLVKPIMLRTLAFMHERNERSAVPFLSLQSEAGDDWSLVSP